MVLPLVYQSVPVVLREDTVQAPESHHLRVLEYVLLAGGVQLEPLSVLFVQQVITERRQVLQVPAVLGAVPLDVLVPRLELLSRLVPETVQWGATGPRRHSPHRPVLDYVRLEDMELHQAFPFVLLVLLGATVPHLE